MQLYFIRHAQSENNQLWSETGSNAGRFCDPGLSDLGKKQTRVLADFIGEHHTVTTDNPYDDINSRRLGFTHLYTSLMERAVLTGAAVANRLDLPLFGLIDAHEGGGIYLENSESGELIGQRGKTTTELLALSSRLVLPDINPDGWWNRPFENREERIERAYRLLKKLTDRHGETDDRVALFSHGAFFNYFLTAIVGLDQRTNLWAYMNNTGITRFDLNGNGYALIYTNRTEHLPPELLS